MNTRELIQRLNELDPKGTMRVLIRMCSDYELLAADDVNEVEGVEKPTACYVMRSHRTMSDEDKANAETFILFPGN